MQQRLRHFPQIDVLAILFVLILFLGGVSWVRLYDGKHLIQNKLQNRWEQTIRETLFAHQQYVQNASYALPEHVLHLELDSLLQLKSWSGNQSTPDVAQLQKQWQNPNSELLQTQQCAFWHLKLKHKNHYHSYLITLSRTYSIDNDFFTPYVFGQEDFPRIIKFDRIQFYGDADFPTVQLSPGAQISYRVQGYEPLAEFYWLAITGLAIIFGIICLLRLLAKLHSRYRPFTLELCLTAGLVLLRLAMLWLQIPHRFSSIKLFSPEVLAISSLNPSLGDVLINFSLLMVLAFRWWRFLDLQKIQPNKTASVLAGFGTIILSSGLSWLFFYLFYTACLNSKIYYEVSDIFRLDVYSVLLFTAALLILGSFYMIAFSGVCLWLRLMPEKSFAYAAREGSVFLLGLTLLLVMLGQSPWTVVFAGVLFLALAFSIGILREFALQKSIIPSIIIVIVGFAWITNVAVSESYQQQSQVQLSRYASRFTNPRDLITEFEFDNLVAEIQQDTALYRSSAKSANVITSEFTQKLLNIHLSSGLRGYDIHVFLFDQNGLRIDNQFMELPTIPYDFKRTIGRATLSKQLFQITIPNNLSDYAYLGRFKVPLEPWKEVWVQLELQPKIGKTDRLYPQLLLDNSLRQRLNLPEGFSLAIYRNQQMVESIGGYEFSALYMPPPRDATHGHWMNRDANFFQVESNTGRVIQLCSPKRTVFQVITAFSFLVYFYLTIVFLAALPILIHYWRKQVFFSRPSFAQRIQLILAGMTFIPLLIMGLLSTPQFRSFYLQTIRFRLSQDLTQCAVLLQQQPYLLAELSKPSTSNPATTDALSRLGQVLAADLNLFRTDGKLFSSTRPRIFQASLIAENMNPAALSELSSRKIRAIITKETIGKLTYLSGYHVIMDNQYKVIAFLNLPYLSQQGILENQLKQFLAYLINLYVVTLLVVVVGGYFIGRSVTYPLQLLKQRLEGIALGKQKHTIEWNSSDEIGAIIHSYNEMLAKLSENEKILAKNERELAWREMAKQVAHEIKNPLTPMKLGIQHLAKVLNQENAKTQQINTLITSLLVQIDSLTYIANSFSQFAAMPSAQKDDVDLVQLLNSVQQLYMSSPEGTVTFESAVTTVIIWADKDQLMRVFSNLVKNALQAMNTYGQIKITLAIDNQDAFIQVIDNGSGIPEEIQAKIFEPNFSTKNSGMGLGLAISQKIIEQSGGYISLRSVWGVGTTFTVVLPRKSNPIK